MPNCIDIHLSRIFLTYAQAYLLLQRHAIFLLKALALADQVALLGEDGGSRGHLVRGAVLAAGAAQGAHLLLVAADAVAAAIEGVMPATRSANIW